MRVIVYVEGPSDKLAMNELLGALIQRKKQQGVDILFYEAPEGDKKKSVLTKVPVKAVNIILNDPDAVVVAMPDLYPFNKGFPHTNYEELKNGVFAIFMKKLEKENQAKDKKHTEKELAERFHIFCFKHDLEALVLASEKALCDRLQVENIKVAWKLPVEDQDNDNPPKRIVENLFKKQNDRYKSPVDAPLILGAADYRELCEKCPQCFKPFVEFLESVH